MWPRSPKTHSANQLWFGKNNKQLLLWHPADNMQSRNAAKEKTSVCRQHSRAAVTKYQRRNRYLFQRKICNIIISGWNQNATDQPALKEQGSKERMWIERRNHTLWNYNPIQKNSHHCHQKTVQHKRSTTRTNQPALKENQSKLKLLKETHLIKSF